MLKFPERRREHVRIEIIPMIDVMMFLLVFFVLISINVLPATGQKVSLPGSAKPARIVEPNRVTITITKDGQLELDGKSTTLAQITSTLAAEQKPDAPIAAVINGDQASVLQNLVDVLGSLKAAGVVNASILSKDR